MNNVRKMYKKHIDNVSLSAAFAGRQRYHSRRFSAVVCPVVLPYAHGVDNSGSKGIYFSSAPAMGPISQLMTSINSRLHRAAVAP
jgi:hypothetical protein